MFIFAVAIVGRIAPRRRFRSSACARAPTVLFQMRIRSFCGSRPGRFMMTVRSILKKQRDDEENECAPNFALNAPRCQTL